MCTVTFVPSNLEEFVLTSNRDEAPNRKTLSPRHYMVDQVELLFPKDEVAGGTWLGVSDKKRLICLLNGGFEAHSRKKNYRMSRGIVVTELLTSIDALRAIDEFNFDDIEPFTIIMVDWREKMGLYQLVWDGIETHITKMPIEPRIWSSSLLYNKEIKARRQNWFSKFMNETHNPTANELLHFHKTAGEGNRQSNLIMDKGFVKTKSISQVSLKTNGASFRYEDLQTQLITQTRF